MRKTITSLLAIVLTLSCVFSLAACGNTEKNITVVVREQGSGTREAFDKVVTDGEHFLEEKDANGKKVYNTTNTAVQQTKTGTVLSTVASDKNAIGYISLGSLNDSVKVVSVDGVVPSEATVLDGTYKIQRPFVVMTNANVTLNPITADFMNYLKSADTKAHAEAAGCIFLEDGTKRANEVAHPLKLLPIPNRQVCLRVARLLYAVQPLWKSSSMRRQKHMPIFTVSVQKKSSIFSLKDLPLAEKLLKMIPKAM